MFRKSIRRLTVTQENTLRDGVIESRLIRINIETRIIGQAELVVDERPMALADAAQFASWENRGVQQ